MKNMRSNGNMIILGFYVRTRHKQRAYRETKKTCRANQDTKLMYHAIDLFSVKHHLSKAVKV
jgi:hypothetical protein